MSVQERVARWPLTGRDSELDAFATAWANRRCQALVIFGPAGVGKTRLAEECLARAAHEGLKAGHATATAAAATVPLGAIAHLIPAGVDLSDPAKGFTAVAAALSGSPHKRRRWAVWIDDLHLLDATSAVLLRQLMDTSVVRLIGTVRTGEPVTEAVEALTCRDTVHRIDLTAFSREQAGAVLQGALGGPVGRRTLHELYTASGGNALYLRELVLGALQAGALASDGEIWELAGDRPVGTPRLAELIGIRLAAADVRARPVLELLALAEPIALADAQTIAPMGVLVGLEEAGLVQAINDRRRTTVQLAHPLYGEVLRVGIPVPRRRTLLLAQAERIESRGARRRDDALHTATWHLAATGSADPALLVQAATLAEHAHDDARTVALLRALPESASTMRSRLMLGHALTQMGEWSQAETEFAEADALARSERERLAIVRERSTNLLWGSADYTKALAIVETARAQITSETGRHVLRILEGWMRVMAGQLTRGLDLLDDLESRVGPASDIDAWLIAAPIKVSGLAVSGRATEATALAEHAYDIHRKAGDDTLAQHPELQRVGLVLAMTEAGHLADACDLGARAFADLAASRATLIQVRMAFYTARAEWLAGHPVTAHRWFAESAARAHKIGALTMRPALAGLTACAALLGDAETAAVKLSEHQATPASSQGAASVAEQALGAAWLHVAHGDLARARTVLVKAAETARKTGHITSEALLLTDVARLGGAKEVAGRLAELAEVCDGALAPARAHLAVALANDDPHSLMTAADELEALGADLLAAEAATAAAVAWQRAGHARPATAATQQAQTCAARCQGARTPLLASAATTAALTAREKEIALLAAANTPSKDIAAALHLSVSTVDNHLQHAYAKLGVTTRRELAGTLGTGTPTKRPAGPTSTTP